MWNKRNEFLQKSTVSFVIGLSACNSCTNYHEIKYLGEGGLLNFVDTFQFWLISAAIMDNLHDKIHA
jgi:hypothetical protein